jgi:large subunit ribosomal protein L9
VKVIFLEDVPNVALAGETREVADGYGRNYLLPRKLAVLANSAASNIVEAQLKKVAAKRAQAAAEMSEVADKINGMEITLKAKVGEKERLYGSITGTDIADELSSRAGLVIDKRKIELEEPIRQIGSYEVTVRFTQDITAVVIVTVASDSVAEEKKEEKPEEKKAKKKRQKETEAVVEEAETVVEEIEAKVEEAETVVEETEVKVEEAEAKVEEAETVVEEAEAVVEEAEVKVEEAEAVVEETEVKIEEVEKPKAKKKSKKKTETKVKETGAEVEVAEEKETEPGE